MNLSSPLQSISQTIMPNSGVAGNGVANCHFDYTGRTLLKFPGTQALILGFVCTLPETPQIEVLYQRVPKELLQREGLQKEEVLRETFLLPNAYIRLDRDDVLTVMLPEQKHRWAIAADMVAATIDAEVRNIRVEIIPNRDHRIHTNIHPEAIAQINEFCRLNLLHALSVARRMLIYAAALKWNLTIEQCTTRNGFVHNSVTQDSLRYSDLISDAAALSPLR